ncbi:NitT/TauT family transport system substrate-binding protein [Amphibacillus marinus]|uniref:NitT/TauT family transport system substrate-binding protein n=1 Tax=Amphibacillus marinus TaxID=872970 RepID=A0A1H8S1R8_9BACI|nr:ABC transporter substrate-binding protein [Amphibacillus marinus]SEO72476.1 NitT/TauT family transport system substrate-binding protein [Amphibacillus marinus]
MKRVMKLLAVALMLLVFVGCSSDEALTTIRVAEVTRSIFYAPQYVALELGYFEDEGLEVELQTIAGGDKVMIALLSNNSDIGLVGSETSIYVAAQGAEDPIINFAQLTQTDGTFLVARAENDHFSFSDLAGETFLGQRKGGMPQMVGEYVLKEHGIDPETDLELIQNIDFANIASSFLAGTGDYVQLFEPTASQFVKDGNGHIVASFGEESGNVPYTVFMAKESFLAEHEDAVLKFTRAIYRAQQFVESNEPEAIAEIVQPFFVETDGELLTSAVARYKAQGSYANNPLLEQASWEQLKTIMSKAGELPADIDYEELVNRQFAEQVLDE